MINLISLTTICYSQKISVYKKYLVAELRASKIHSVLQDDWNCDHKKDYAIILRDRKVPDLFTLYIIYSSSDSLKKQNLGVLGDTMDLHLESCVNCPTFRERNQKYECRGIYVTSNEWEYVFKFDRSCIQGLFTSHKLSDYFNDTKTDWVAARKIVNPGSKRAAITAKHGEDFYACLQ